MLFILLFTRSLWKSHDSISSPTYGIPISKTFAKLSHISDFGGRYNFPLNIMFSIVCFFCRYEMWYRGHLCHLILLIMFTKKWLNSFLASMKQSHGWAFQKALVVKNLLASPGGTRDMGLIPESGRSPGGRNGSPLQCSCLEDPEDRGAWRAAVLGVAKSQTGLSS